MDADLIGKLKGLGLTEYETKAYITLLSLQKAKAAELAEASGIPRSRVYDVLNGREVPRSGSHLEIDLKPLKGAVIIAREQQNSS